MKKIVELVQNLQNLNRIKRTGGNLALGLPTDWNISIAEHSYTVSYLTMIFADLAKSSEVNTEKLLRYALMHDWREMVIGDIPAGSPSYGSFWEVNIREATAKAGDKAIKEIGEYVEEEVKIESVELNETEKKIIKAADLTAYLIEMQEWKYLGFRHDGWEMIWFNTVDILGKVELPFIPKLVDEIKEIYKKDAKRPSPWLAKKSKQSNPEHKI